MLLEGRLALPRLQLGAEKDDGRVWLDSMRSVIAARSYPGRIVRPTIIVNAIGVKVMCPQQSRVTA